MNFFRFDKYDAIGIAIAFAIATAICVFFEILLPWSLLVYFIAGLFTDILVTTPLRKKAKG